MSLAIFSPDAEETFANSTFDALMWALARPGSIQRMPAPGYDAFAASLLDRECVFHSADPQLIPALRSTGARNVPLVEAEYVFADLSTAEAVQSIRGLRLGNLLYPDESATLIAPATFGGETRLQLSGPGIDETTAVSVGGVEPSFWTMRTRLLRYPLGFDLYLVDADRIIGIPRSTIVKVL